MKRAVLFDLDDTLVPEFATYGAAFAATCTGLLSTYGIDEARLWASVRDAAGPLWRASPVLEYCQRVQIGSLAALFSAFPGDGPEMSYLRTWAPTYRRETWTRALAALGLASTSMAEEFAEVHLACFAASCRPYADVVPALEELGRSYALAVITNGPADVQRTKLRVTGLDRFFSAVIISSEIGFAKPHERAFAAAVEALQVGKEEIVMVGDHPERDVVGAQDAGIPTVIWVDRTGAGAPPGFHPPHRVGHLGELSALILGI